VQLPTLKNKNIELLILTKMQEKIDTNRVLLPVLKSPDKLWGCIASNGNVDYSTLSYTRTGSIKKCVLGLNPDTFNWRYFRKKGWKCVKLDVSYQYRQ
jgi:hypothetical protein